MTEAELGQVRFGSMLIDYSIRRSRRRRKTVEIIVDPVDGILVAAPIETLADDIRAIVRKRAPWILRRTSEERLRTRHKDFVSGETLPYLGRQARLFVELADVLRVQVKFEHWRFTVRVPPSLQGDERRRAIETALSRWYAQRAVISLSSRVSHWSARLGVSAKAVLTRNQRQRWASCGPDGTLRINWRVVMLEPALIDYVIIHELSHLITRNHSQTFWSLVASVLPDFKIRRLRLREAGRELVL